MTDTKHSPSPFTAPHDQEMDIYDQAGNFVCTTNGPLWLENSRFIRTACNSHYEFAGVLREIANPYSEWDDDRIYDDLGSTFGSAVISARNALAKVKP